MQANPRTIHHITIIESVLALLRETHTRSNFHSTLYARNLLFLMQMWVNFLALHSALDEVRHYNHHQFSVNRKGIQKQIHILISVLVRNQQLTTYGWL